MAFPLTQTGTFPIRDRSSESDLLDEVARALRTCGAENVVIRSGTVEFSVPWRVTHGPLWSIDGGSVHVVEDPGNRHFRFEISRRRAALTVALGSYGWLGGMSMVAFHQSLLFAFGIGTFAFIFLFTVGTALSSSFEMVLPFHRPVSGAV
jgi:hypothetical protein